MGTSRTSWRVTRSRGGESVDGAWRADSRCEAVDSSAFISPYLRPTQPIGDEMSGKGKVHSSWERGGRCQGVVGAHWVEETVNTVVFLDSLPLW